MELEVVKEDEVAVATSTSTPEDKVTMKRNINVLHGTCLVVSSVVGTGIFISPNAISRNVNSPAMSIMVWLLGGVVATIGGITYCELGTMFPSNGAEITYLRKAFGALLSFLSCFLTQFILSGVGMAVQFLTFSRYFWRIFYEDDSQNWFLDKGLCILVLAAIIMMIALKPDFTLKVVDVVTFVKLGALAIVIMMGIIHLVRGRTENLEVGFDGTNWNAGKWSSAWTTVLWTYGGWDLTKIIVFSLTIITSFYMLAVISYHAVLPMNKMNSDKPLASEMAEEYMGQAGVVLFAAAVAISTLGGNVVALLGYSRYLQAAGAQEILPAAFGLVSKRFRTPIFSLIYLGTTTAIFISVGNVYSLISYASYTQFAFSSLCAVGVMVMRFTLPQHHRPFRVWLVFPLVTALFGVYMFVMPWFGDDVLLSGVWLGVTLLGGIPCYFLCVNKKYRLRILVSLSEKSVTFLSRALNSEVNLQ